MAKTDEAKTAMEIEGLRGKGLRMKELTAATGLPKSAILHYVARGLLPEPAKTSRNMAYYDPQCIERIAFIKSLQERYAFPLNKIKSLLASRDEGRDTAGLIELCEVIFTGRERPTFDKKSFCAATGLEPRHVKVLRDAGLLLPLDEDMYDEQDVSVGRFYAQGLARGIEVRDLAFYAETAKRIVDEEMALRQRLTADLPEDQDAAVTARLVRAARAVRTYVLDRSFQRHVAGLRDLKEEGNP